MIRMCVLPILLYYSLTSFILYCACSEYKRLMSVKMAACVGPLVGTWANPGGGNCYSH